MFEKLITNLKNSLSSKKKGEANPDAEEGSEVEEQNSELEPQEEGEGSNSETTADDAAAKKRSMIIKVVIALAVAYLVVDQFILKEDPATEVATAPMPRKKKNKPIPSPGTENVAGTVTPNPEASALPSASQTPANDSTVTTNDQATTTPAPVENVNVMDKNNTQPDVAPNSTSSPDTAISAVDVTPTPAPSPAPTEEVPTVNIGEVKQVEKQIDKELDKLIEGENKKDTSISAKIVEKVEAEAGSAEVAYVEPPGYEINGRGLVYNCKEKFWVCIDKTSFLQCAKNMKANKANKKPAECVTSNVYATNEDCALIQKHNVSINAPTDFCSN